MGTEPESHGLHAEMLERSPDGDDNRRASPFLLGCRGYRMGCWQDLLLHKKKGKEQGKCWQVGSWMWVQRWRDGKRDGGTEDGQRDGGTER